MDKEISAPCIHESRKTALLTLVGALESYVELLHVVIHERDFVVAHEHLHDVGLDAALGTAHLGAPGLVGREGVVLLSVEVKVGDLDKGGSGRHWLERLLDRACGWCLVSVGGEC